MRDVKELSSHEGMILDESASCGRKNSSSHLGDI